MRIGITGAQGVGKTTLAEELARILDLPLIEEQARLVAKEMDILNLRDLKHDPKKATNFQWNCLKYQLSAEKKHDSFVSDRTTLDNLAYWAKWHSCRNQVKDNIMYSQIAFRNIQNYDLIIYIPPELFPKNDGFRSTDRQYQLEIDMYIRSMLAFLQPVWITVEGSLENRISKVIISLNKTMLTKKCV